MIVLPTILAINGLGTEKTIDMSKKDEEEILIST
jgi:hypothetical protein